MRPFLLMQFLMILPFFGISQDISKLTSLQEDVSETSGLIFFEDRLITHNDSGGMNALYEINSVNGNISRTVNIQNASNIDWEDISQDDEYIYIGDFGNNNGNRKNLRIYKILKTDYLNSQNVSAELIEFAYQDQNDFTSSPNQTNFDAEALISFGPDLYIFTKNWVDRRTNIYKVPKVPGTYSIEKIDEFDAGGLITGATFNPIAKKVILTGYSGIRAFAIELRGFSDDKFSNGVIDKYSLTIPITESFQIEAITYLDATNHYLSAEKNVLGDASLYSLSSNTLAIDDFNLIQNQVYPNPAGEILSIETNIDLEKVEIYDYLGKLMLEDTSGNKELNISEFPKGIYFIKLHSGNRVSAIKFLKD